MKAGVTLWLAAWAIVLFCGCQPQPARPVVDEIEISGLDRVDEAPILDGIATAESPLLFGLFAGVLEYSTYDPNVLQRDLLRIERYLRARGHYEAKVIAARVVRLENGHVRVELSVHEGPVVRVSRIDPGLGSVPFDLVLPVNKAREMKEGDVLDEADLEADRSKIESVLGDAGYAFAKVEVRAQVNVAAGVARVKYQIEPGPKARYGPIRFIGLREIPEGPVRKNLGLSEGELYSESDIKDARASLVNLGVFSAVEITRDRSHPETGIVPLQIRVEESSLRALRLGGGSRFDVLRLSAHLTMGWEHKNFLGGMRRFSVSASPGVTLFPTRLDNVVPWTRYLRENYLRLELRQPSVLEDRTTGFLRGEYNIYPLLYPLPKGVDPNDEPIIGYHEVKSSTGVERALFSHHLRVQPSYNWQANFPFSYQGRNPLDSVRVSFPELFAILDFRDDPIETREGITLSNSLQVAGYIFQGSVSDVRIKPELRTYLPVGRAVLATRTTLGLLLPGNYGDTLNPESAEGENAVADPTDPAVVADQQKLLFRAFYSGGPNSNRGYPYRGVGPHGPIGFLVPTGLDCSLERVNPDGSVTSRDVDQLPDGCIRPLGGLALWEASLEIRMPLGLGSPFQIVTFLDASDLTRSAHSFRFNTPHLSTGLGFRYGTPVGPIRLDIGWRIPGAQAIGKRELPPEEGRPGEPILGVFPGAVHLAIGEAF